MKEYISHIKNMKPKAIEVSSVVFGRFVLEKLNKLYQEQCDLARTSPLPDDAIRHTQLAERYKQRHQKCQDAIELLEEYLAFKEEQENHTL